MIVKNENLYSFSQAAKVLDISTTRLFELVASPYVEKVYQGNSLYFTKDTIRKLVLRSDI
ncbi:hypothetical protein ACIQ4I_19950 [Rummeliibacillus sp. NPDC094406]|uniref:hypothetical protein n=1 Tax=Rummeliibacillus sp. NPDC094406 TaxID=3364511 RepID=UPI0037F53FD2